MHLNKKRNRCVSKYLRPWIVKEDEEMEELVNEKNTHRNKRLKNIYPWTDEENDKLLKLVTKYGQKNWTWLASHLNNRTGKQCRERYVNRLDPSIIRTPWTVEEEDLLIDHQKTYGTSWAQFSRTILPGRSQNDIKNHFHLISGKRKYRRMHYIDYLIENIESETFSE